MDWKDIEVIHTTSYDNYFKLQEIGVKVVSLTYITYHDRLLLWNYIETIEELRRHPRVGSFERSSDYIETIEELRRAPIAFTDKGSGKDVINFDASRMRTLEEFLADTHGAAVANIAPQIQRARTQLKQLLSVEHDRGSPLARR